MFKRRITGGGSLKAGFGGGGAFSITNFLGLTDTPNSYVGEGSKVLAVNVAETAIEFIPGRGAVNGLASLDGTGKIPASEIPSIAITEYLGSVANQVAMLALTGQVGDWCIRSDLATTWIITANDGHLITDWTELAYPVANIGQVLVSVGDPSFGYLGSKFDVDSESGLAYSIVGVLNQLVHWKLDFPALTEKLTLADSDLIAISDSADGNIHKKVQRSKFALPKHLFYAEQMLSPNNADWVINALASASPDSLNNALVVRQFDDTTEEGIGFSVEVPSAATGIILRFRSRAQTAPGVATIVTPRLYTRQIADNAAVGAWSAATDLTNIDIPTNANFQFDSQTITLAALGITAGRIVQFELTRKTGIADLAGDWNLFELIVEFY